MYQVQADAELAQILHQEELDELERVHKERVVQEEASQTSINKELDDIQAMIEANEQMAARLQSEEQEKYTIEEKARMLAEMIKEDDTEKEELRASMDIAPRDDVAIDVESLATKYPIVDWKTHVLTENMMYYQIIRADGSSKNYKIFSEMLDDFDRQDVMDLHRLVQERYDTTSLGGYDLLLWGDLKILFESNAEDEIWKNQHDYNLISWRLFD
ncbi:hypothetical protein Tco_1008800 [Tanacetum coccineum]